MKKTALLLLTAFLSFSAHTHTIQLNQPLPNISVAKDGEITLNGSNVAFQTWSSAQLTGKVRIVQHIAGRSKVKEKNQALIDAIKAAQFPADKYQTTTIINADDAVIGTGMFVKSSAQDGKKSNPHSQVILDQNGAVKAAWQLKAQESSVIVLDKNGTVQFVAEGKLNQEQIQRVIKLVQNLL